VALSLEAAIKVVGIDLHAVFERLVVHYHVTWQHRDAVLLDQVSGQVCRAIGNYAYGHIPLVN
jgi:hypothetical protein